MATPHNTISLPHAEHVKAAASDASQKKLLLSSLKPSDWQEIMDTTDDPTLFLRADLLLKDMKLKEIRQWIDVSGMGTIPDFNTMDLLRQHYFKDEEWQPGISKADHFETLVGSKRFDYMREAYLDKNRRAFSIALSQSHPKFIGQALIDYFEHGRESPGQGFVVASPGSYLRALRCASGLSKEQCSHIGNLASATINNLEADSVDFPRPTYIMYMMRLEDEVKRCDVKLSVEEEDARKPRTVKISDYFQADNSHQQSICRLHFPNKHHVNFAHHPNATPDRVWNV